MKHIPFILLAVLVISTVSVHGLDGAELTKKDIETLEKQQKITISGATGATKKADGSIVVSKVESVQDPNVKLKDATNVVINNNNDNGVNRAHTVGEVETKHQTFKNVKFASFKQDGSMRFGQADLQTGGTQLSLGGGVDVRPNGEVDAMELELRTAQTETEAPPMQMFSVKGIGLNKNEPGTFSFKVGHVISKNLNAIVENAERTKVGTEQITMEGVSLNIKPTDELGFPTGPEFGGVTKATYSAKKGKDPWVAYEFGEKGTIKTADADGKPKTEDMTGKTIFTISEPSDPINQKTSAILASDEFTDAVKSAGGVTKFFESGKWKPLVKGFAERNEYSEDELNAITPQFDSIGEKIKEDPTAEWSLDFFPPPGTTEKSSKGSPTLIKGRKTGTTETKSQNNNNNNKNPPSNEPKQPTTQSQVKEGQQNAQPPSYSYSNPGSYQTFPSPTSNFWVGRVHTAKHYYQQARNYLFPPVNPQDPESYFHFIGKADHYVLTPDEYSQSVIKNGQFIIYQDGFLNVKYADLLIRDNSIVTNLQDLISGGTQFFIGKADSLYSECAKFHDVYNSTFTITDDEVEIETDSKTSYNITDCIFNNVYFVSNPGGSLKLSKNVPPTYSVANGTIIISQENFTERIDVNNSAEIEFDLTYGIKCVTIEPEGTYWYNDHNNLKKDFAVNVPSETSKFKLCIRRNPTQNFSDYDGMINFVQNFVELQGEVKYLRYPQKNNEVSSLLMSSLIEDMGESKAKLQLIEDFGKVDKIEIEDSDTPQQNKTITNPNNFFILKEGTRSDNTHRLVKLHRTVKKTKITQPRFNTYQTDYFSPIIFSDGNAIIQREGLSNIRMLSADHSDIQTIVS